jgi:hypothetical protein
MGNNGRTDEEIRANNAAFMRAERTFATKRRMTLAKKIVLAVVDRISNDIIRPGPKPEERECYVMAEELREHSNDLHKLVAEILKIEEEE